MIQDKLKVKFTMSFTDLIITGGDLIDEFILEWEEVINRNDGMLKVYRIWASSESLKMFIKDIFYFTSAKLKVDASENNNGFEQTLHKFH